MTVSFIEPFDINSRFQGAPGPNPLTCNDAIGFSSGQTFTATLTSFMGNHGCFSGVSDGFTVGGWTWQRDPNLNGVSGGDVLEGLYLGALGMCTGRLSLSVHTDKLPTTPPVPGQPPTATAAFSFSATGDAIGDLACPQSCGGTMVATVSSP